MKNRKNRSRLLALLLIATMLLPSCSWGIDDPIDDSDLGGDGAGLSEDEAAALFGKEISAYADMFDYPYLYYKGILSSHANGEKLTVYRYNIETGESEFACQDSVCTHDKDSGCPFENYFPFGQITVLDGKVIYTATHHEGIYTKYSLEWYDPKTRKHGVWAEDADNRFVVGDTLYFDRCESSVETTGSDVKHVLTRELWKYDKAQKKAVLVASTSDRADFTPEPVFYHGEERIVISSNISYDGKEDASKNYLYWIDPETGARTPVLREGIKTAGTGWFAGDYLFDAEILHGDGSQGYVPYCYNLETGEKKKIGELGEFEAVTMIPTEKYLLAVCDDPTGKATKILRCYDYRTGQWAEKEYPLYGEYDGTFLRYYRGKLYFFESRKEQAVEAGETPEFGGYLIWDILTGEQTLVPNSVGP